LLLYIRLIRAHLEYAVSVWNPHYQTFIEKTEKVQKRATKLVITIKRLHYEDRLRRLKLPTLKYRRIRGDMIELYKKYDNDIILKTIGKCIAYRDNMIRQIIDLPCSSHIYSMICVNLVFPIRLSHCGIVYQTM